MFGSLKIEGTSIKKKQNKRKLINMFKSNTLCGDKLT